MNKNKDIRYINRWKILPIETKYWYSGR
jgi:hypothetical protein